jgi:hypothetical protein
VSLLSLDDVWPGSPQSAVFRVGAATADEANALAKAESRELGFQTKTRGYTVEVEPGVWHVELRVRTAGVAP